MQVTTLGIDLAKRVLQVHGVDKYGKGGPAQTAVAGPAAPLLGNLARASSGSKPVGGPLSGARHSTMRAHDPDDRPSVCQARCPRQYNG
jgi:hypothetical protein